MTYKDWISKENLILLKGWAQDGLTNEQIAQNIGINKATLQRWKNEKSEFCEALKSGRAVCDYIVQNELYQSTQTRTITVRKPIKVKTVKTDGKKKIEEEKVVYAEEQVVIPANVTAQIFWLKNRKPSDWKDKREEVISQGTNQETIKDIARFINGID